MIYGDGKQTRDFVFVGDIVRANLQACVNEEAVGRVLNVASGRRVSLLKLVDTLNGLLGTQVAPTFEPERTGDIRHSAGDGRQLAKLFHFGAETLLADGLEQLIVQTQQA